VRDDDYRISIVITSYNQRSYLVEAIESVLAQTLPAHEIIVADDCSADGSPDTIRDYERRHPGLIKSLLQPKNQGIPRNRNAALRLVTGNYVGILDGDDVFLSHKLERQVAALRADPECKAVYGNFRIVDSRGEPLRVKWRSPQPSGVVFADVARGKMGLLRTLIAEYALVQEAGFMDERFARYDGLRLSIALAARCRVAYIDDILLHKRDHAASDSKSITTDEHLRELQAIYDEVLPLLHTHVTDADAHAIQDAWQRLFAARDHSSP
jgi:glycosyltransferase involved in cell wall biosynthesis